MNEQNKWKQQFPDLKIIHVPYDADSRFDTVSIPMVKAVDVREQCLSKQKVKEAWNEFKVRSTPNKNNEVYSEESRRHIFEKMDL